jgi:hypothetical protein
METLDEMVSGGHRLFRASLIKPTEAFGMEGEDFMASCALVRWAGGFIGGHLVKRLNRDGLWGAAWT